MSGRVDTHRVRRRKRVRAEEYQQYIIRIKSWEHSYSFGTTRGMRFESLPLYEYSTLQFSGEIIKPVAGKYTKGILLLAGRHDSLGDGEEDPPSSVGYINALEESLQAYVPLPRNRIAELLVLAQSNRLQAAILNGAPLKWRKRKSGVSRWRPRLTRTIIDAALACSPTLISTSLLSVNAIA